jgi:hypothetical protein
MNVALAGRAATDSASFDRRVVVGLSALDEQRQFDLTARDGFIELSL